MESLGKALIAERKSKQIELEEISRKTNISTKALQAMEEDRFGDIPGKFYLNQYIKSYMTAIGGDVPTFRENNNEAIRIALQIPAEKNKTYLTKVRYSRFRNRGLAVIALTILGILGLAGAGYVVNNSLKEGGVLAKMFTSGGAAFAPIREPALPFPTPDLRFSFDRHPLTVAIRFRENCWMQAYRGGRKVVEKVFKKGENAEFNGYRLSFLLGNPSSVDFLVNGREVAYLKDLSRSERIDLTPTDLERIFSK